MSLIIIEVLERFAQGKTEPYLCRGDDGEVYFVKGRSASRRELIAEWLCARLGEVFGLPIAPYAIATVPEELIKADLTGWLRDLGAGDVFASRRIKATELTIEHLSLVPKIQRLDVIAFDFWVHNGDRNLTAIGGNSNLLWNTGEGGSLVVIDHNLAFDPEFSAKDFFDLHVFKADIFSLFNDFNLVDSYNQRLSDTLKILEEACCCLPESWIFIDPEKTIPVDFPFTQVRKLLEQDFSVGFRRVTTSSIKRKMRV